MLHLRHHFPGFLHVPADLRLEFLMTKYERRGSNGAQAGLTQRKETGSNASGIPDAVYPPSTGGPQAASTATKQT
jgi:hypothetical protein